MTGNKLFKKFMIIIAAVSIAAVLYGMWRSGCFLPLWAEWNNRVLWDNTEEYQITLRHRSAAVRYHDEIIWSSPQEIKVQDILSCDFDGDGEDELLLLCWKRGRYGQHRPFWVEKDEKSWSQHIFVYEYQENQIKPKWMSSYIGQEVVSLSVKEEASSPCHLLLTDKADQITSWVWDSWGFAREPSSVSFTVFGDNLIHEPIYRYGLQNEGDFGFLFENMHELLSASDISIINQETPLVDNSSLYGDYPRFGTPLNVGEAIADAGFDVVTCGTNHILDRGAYGINTTWNFFEEQDILCLGIQPADNTAYHPYEILVKNEIRFAMLNYTYGTNGIKIPEENPNMVHLLENENQISEDIKNARSEADFVIIFVHWGTEYSETIDDFQEKWAQIFLESKADVVVGTHPHVLQPYEILEGPDGHQMLIYYSIGNYISAQREKECVKGGIAGFTVSLTPSGYQITEYSLQPLKIKWHKGGKYTTEF